MKKEEEQEVLLQEIQEDTDKKLKAIKEEEESKLAELDDEFEQIKQEKLISFQDKLKNARNDANFQQILGDYQKAQQQVDQDLKKQKDKQREKLLAQLQARKSQAKLAAQKRKENEFQSLDEKYKQIGEQDTKNKELLMENLRQEENEDALGLQDVENNGQLMDEMEAKRRDEEQFRLHQERLQRRQQGEAMKEYTRDDREIQDEIQKIADGTDFDPYQDAVKKRQELANRINASNDEGERQALMNELNGIDKQVKDQLA